MEARFDEIVKKLTPSPVFLKAARGVSHEIFETLKACPKVSVARAMVAGSVGKKTALSETVFLPDFDLVVFVNKTDDQKDEDILKDCSDALTKKFPGYKTKPRNAISGNLLQFTLPVTWDGQTKEIEFDLVIAKNFGDGEIQGQTVLEKIGENPSLSTIHLYGPGLTQETMACMEQLEKGATRNIVLIAKFWDKILRKWDDKWGFIGGRSYMIELIAIHAAQRESSTTYRGFMEFLTLMSRLEALVVIFNENYNSDQIPPDVLKQLPLVMDPVNYYYNVAEKIDAHNIENTWKFKSYAVKTKRMLEGNPTYALDVDNFMKIMGF